MSIRLSNVWFRYDPRNNWVLKEINYEFKEGRTYVVVGPNGSGKTTLLKVASLIYRPQKGDVITWGRNLWVLERNEALKLRRKVVYVHEKPILLRGTVTYNVAFGLTLRGVSRDEAENTAERTIREFGLSYLLYKKHNELSAGEAQLISIIRAIILKPNIIFLDEPLAHLDINKREKIINIINELRNSGTGIVIATHDLYLAKLVSDEALCLEGGVILECEDLLSGIKRLMLKSVTDKGHA